MKKLFKIMELKYKWDEDIYSDVFNICAALTNYHIMKYPLRYEDGVYYKGVIDEYVKQAVEKKQKEKEKREKYAKKMRFSDGIEE